MGIVKKVIDRIAEGVAGKIKTANYNLKDPPTWLRKISGEESETDFTDAYSQIPVVRAAIRARATNVAQVPFKIYPIGSDKEITSGPIVDLYENVNPYMSKYDLWEAQVSYMDMEGDAPVLKDKKYVKGIPSALWPVKPSKVQIAYKDDIPVGYNYTANGKTTFYYWDEVIFPKYFNPHDSLRGMGLVKALQNDIEAEWGAIRFNKLFFDKGQTPGMIFTTPTELSDPAFNRMKRELIERRQGVKNSHESLILDSGMTVANVRPTNRDMEYLEMRKFFREEVAMIFKVPKPELSLYEDVNYATAQSSDIGFWKKTLIPLMRKLEDKHNTDFLTPLGFEGRFDITAIDVLNDEILQKAQTAKIFWDMGIPAQMINERLNLGFENLPEEEPAPAPQLPPPPKEDEEEMPEEPSKGKHFDQAAIVEKMRTKKWQSTMAPILPIIGKFSKAVRNYFFEIEQAILKTITKANLGAVTKAAGDEFDFVAGLFSDQKLKRLMMNYLPQAIQLGADNVQDMTGRTVSFSIDDSVRRQAAQRFDKITGINETSREAVMSRLKSELAESLEAGEGEGERTQRIVNAVQDSMAANESRARTIARTEMHGAYSQARHESIEEAKPTKKRWISSRDAHVRDSHQDLDGQERAFNEPYENGLMYPLDSASSDAGEVINCRCVEVYDFD